MYLKSKKIVLGLIALGLHCGLTFAQEPTNPSLTPVQPMLTLQDTTLKDLSNDNNKGMDNHKTQNRGSQPAVALSLFGNSHKDKDNNANSSRFVGQIEFGLKGKKFPLFGTVGLGLSNTSYSADIPGYSKRYTLESNSLRIPGYVGFLIGDTEKVHASLRGGAVLNYTINSKTNGEKRDLSGTDRTSWNGSVKFAIGYKIVNFMVEYEFPFQSGGKGVWLFGLHGGF